MVAKGSSGWDIEDSKIPGQENPADLMTKILNLRDIVVTLGKMKDEDNVQIVTHFQSGSVGDSQEHKRT